MAKVPTLRAGESQTTNYGWVKPTVGASVDAWGDYINTDLDGIDTTVKGVSVVANAAYPASNPSGYQTAAQVASVVIGDNRIINGDMRIDQRNNGAVGTANGYTVDRWKYGASQASKGTWQRATAGASLTTFGFGYFLSFVSSSAYTPLATDSFSFFQPIEADLVVDFMWGTPSAQPVTLSFVVTSSLTGTFSGCVSNYAGTRSYPFTYSIPTANIWTKIAVTIPGDTAGTWALQGNGGSIYVTFDLGSGANARGPANAWASGNLSGVTGAQSPVATNGATFYVTGVKLEIGSVATPFNRQSLAKSMADCQRYYSSTVAMFTANTTLSGIYNAAGALPVTMRATPTLTGSPIGSVSGFANAIGSLSVAGSGGGFPASTTVQDGRTSTAAVAPGLFITLINASAEL